MDTQNLNIAQKRMLTYLKNNFPTLPMSVAESIRKTFEAFPDFEIKEGADVLTVDLDEVKLTNNDRDIVCTYSAKNIVENFTDSQLKLHGILCTFLLKSILFLATNTFLGKRIFCPLNSV